jgi:hypothetical protein
MKMKSKQGWILNKMVGWSTAAALLASSGATASSRYSYASDEMSGDEIVNLLSDLEVEVDQNKSRRISPENFSEYQIVVDVFRASAKRPVLGKYFPEYHDATTSTFSETNAVEREKLAKKRYDRLSKFEFAIVSVDGVPTRAYLISGALEAKLQTPLKAKRPDGTVYEVVENGEIVMKETKKSTPSGNFMLTPVVVKASVMNAEGKRVKEQVPFPFLSSSSFERSSMWYGLQVTNDGILMHATPHYYQLGQRASMGCIRQSTPDAMWLWNLVTNESEGRKAMIRIHPKDSQQAVTRLRELIYDPNFIAPEVTVPEIMPVYASPNASRNMVWLVDQINMSHQKIKDYIAKMGHGDYHGAGHDWWNPRTKSHEYVPVPRCGNYDCEEVWGDPLERVAKLREGDREAELEERRKMLELGLPIPRRDSIALGMPVNPIPPKTTPVKTH